MEINLHITFKTRGIPNQNIYSMISSDNKATEYC